MGRRRGGVRRWRSEEAGRLVPRAKTPSFRMEDGGRHCVRTQYSQNLQKQSRRDGLPILMARGVFLSWSSIAVQCPDRETDALVSGIKFVAIDMLTEARSSASETFAPCAGRKHPPRRVWRSQDIHLITTK